MLEYSILILSKVSFDRNLFEKELSKAKRYLAMDELKEFRNRCFEKFGSSAYRQILQKHLN